MRREELPMRNKELGRTGLMVSSLSLGSGGVNRFGQRSFALKVQIMDLVRSALDIGINLFDTSPSYGESEAILGGVLRNVPRDRFIIATKFLPVTHGRISRPEDVVKSVERSLKKLRVDTVDLIQFHAVTPGIYRSVTDSLMPTLEKLRDDGKFRFLGISESTIVDRNHEMLQMALSDNLFDSVMVAYSPANPTAGDGILHLAAKKNVGVICMAAARDIALSQKDVRSNILGLNPQNGWGSMRSGLRSGSENSVITEREFSRPAEAYRFAMSHPAVSTVLTGTTNVEHLRQNAFAILETHTFGHV